MESGGFFQNFEDQENNMNSQLPTYVCVLKCRKCNMLLCKSLQKCGIHSYEVTKSVWTKSNVNYALHLYNE